MIALLFFVACNRTQISVTDEDLLALEERGILSRIDLEIAANFTLYEVRVGDIDQELELRATLSFPVTRNLYFDRTNGYFSGAFVQSGQRVEAGDVLAEMSFDTEYFEIERNILHTRFLQFETRFAEEEAQRLSDIESSRSSLAVSDEEGLERAILELARLELALRQFIFDSEQGRRYYHRRLADLDDAIAPAQIIAPFSGVITFASSIVSGSFVSNWPRVITIIDDSVIYFHVPAPVTAVRFGDVFPMHVPTRSGTPDVIDVQVVTAPMAVEIRTQASPGLSVPGSHGDFPTFSHIVAPVEPIDFYGGQPYDFINATFLVFPRVLWASQSTIIHSRALVRDDDVYFVYVYEDGRLAKRYVTVGAMLGTQVQILTGLEPGQMVVLV